MTNVLVAVVGSLSIGFMASAVSIGLAAIGGGTTTEDVRFVETFEVVVVVRVALAAGVIVLCCNDGGACDCVCVCVCICGCGCGCACVCVCVGGTI